jgi:hypothetical protein
LPALSVPSITIILPFSNALKCKLTIIKAC